MQKRRFGILALAATLLFSGCTAPPETEPAAVIEYLQESEEAQAYIYENDATIKFALDSMFLSLLQGEWTEKSGKADGEKILSIVADDQYEICFFTDGTAMIYFGYIGILQQDRQYYTFAPRENVEKMMQYIIEHEIIDDETTDETPES